MTFIFCFVIIFEIPGSVDALTRLVLVNAIYFKGNWARKFDSSNTKIEQFFLDSKDKTTDVNMMHVDGEFRSGFIESLDARILELPYLVVNLFLGIIALKIFMPFNYRVAN